MRPKWTRILPNNMNFPAIYYVDELVAANTVVTFTPDMLDAFLDDGSTAYTINKDLDRAREQISTLTKLGIDLEGMMEEMQRYHLQKSERQYQSLIQSVIHKIYEQAPTAQ